MSFKYSYSSLIRLADAPVYDVPLVQSLQGNQQWHSNLLAHTGFCHHPPLCQELLQEVSTLTEFHDQPDLRGVLEGTVQARDVGDPACIGRGTD